MKKNIITTKFLALLFAGALSAFNAKAQWIGGGGSTIESDPTGGNVEITAPYNFSVVGGNASISGSLSSGAITASGNISCGSHALTAGGVTCGAITSSGNFSNGSNTLGCGAITSSGNFSNGTHAVTCGAITSSGNFSNGSNTLGCGAITSSGAFSNGSNTLGCGAITSGAITSSGNITSTGNVGIGTSSPTALLDVTGTTTSDTKVNFLNTSTGSVGLELRGTSGFQYIDFEDASTSNTGSGTPDYRNRIISSSTSFQITPNGSNGITMLNAGNVGIGTGTSLTANTQFDVLYNTGTALSAGSKSYASHSINSNTGTGSLFSQTFITGVYGESSGSSTSGFAFNRGGSFNASNGYSCQGVYGISTPSSSGNLSMGGAFSSDFAAAAANGTSYGVYSLVGSNGTLGNFAIYGSAPSSVGNTKPNWAGYFSGDVYVNGNGWINAAWNVSDKKYKTDINNINNPLDIIKKLNPKSYQYITDNADGLSFPSEKQYGFIAQDVQQILPELVRSVSKPQEVDANGKIIHASVKHLGVNYNAFFALTIAAVQQQQSKIDRQDSIINKQDSINKALQKQINQILAANTGNNNTNSTTAINIQNLNLSDADVVVLNQNQPNPFAEQTLVTYNIPQNANAAQIVFYDVNGKQINSVTITTKGKGALNVYANDLSNGVYSYTLIVDGKVIDTKKMVKQQ
jgi:hypothetical protein